MLQKICKFISDFARLPDLSNCVGNRSLEKNNENKKNTNPFVSYAFKQGSFYNYRDLIC